MANLRRTKVDENYDHQIRDLARRRIWNFVQGHGTSGLARVRDEDARLLCQALGLQPGVWETVQRALAWAKAEEARRAEVA